MPYPDQTGTGLTDEQAAKRQRYEDALDRWAGFEPGESQLVGEEIMARRAARQRAAAHQPQSAAGYSPPQVPFDAVIAQLMTRPGMAEHLEGIDLDGDGIPDVPMGQPPMDPMGRMQWQSMMQQRQQMAQVAQARKAQRKAVNNQVILAQLQARDPMFPHVQRWIKNFVDSLPVRLGRAVLEQVDRTPGAFLEMYSDMRRHFIEELSVKAGLNGFGGHGVMPASVANMRDPREAIRQAVAGRMSAPVLESAGVYDDRLPGASREAQKRALVKRVKAGGAKEGDLLRYLELCGV